MTSIVMMTKLTNVVGLAGYISGEYALKTLKKQISSPGLQTMKVENL